MAGVNDKACMRHELEEEERQCQNEVLNEGDKTFEMDDGRSIRVRNSTCPSETHEDGDNLTVFSHIGDNIYMTYGRWMGEGSFHLRRYDRDSDGRLYPSRYGIRIPLASVCELSDHIQEGIDHMKSLDRDISRSGHGVNGVDDVFSRHLLNGIYMTVEANPLRMQIRKWFMPHDTPQGEKKPTRKGVTLKLFQVHRFAHVFENEFVQQVDLEAHRHNFHDGQLAFFECSICTPFGNTEV